MKVFKDHGFYYWNGRDFEHWPLGPEKIILDSNSSFSSCFCKAIWPIYTCCGKRLLRGWNIFEKKYFSCFRNLNILNNNETYTTSSIYMFSCSICPPFTLIMWLMREFIFSYFSQTLNTCSCNGWFNHFFHVTWRFYPKRKDKIFSRTPTKRDLNNSSLVTMSATLWTCPPNPELQKFCINIRSHIKRPM